MPYNNATVQEHQQLQKTYKLHTNHMIELQVQGRKAWYMTNKDNKLQRYTLANAYNPARTNS